MTAADILRAAKQYLVDHGWCQGHMHSCSGECCMVGAMLFSRDGIRGAWDTKEHDRAYEALYQAVGPVEGAASPLAAWNDKPGRTLAEVLGKFDDAIALAEVTP